jgi:predicted N-acetyltransferase YhbS
MITCRKLLRDEVVRVWEIDRSEVIDAVYYFENGALVLRPEHHDVHGWPPDEAEKYTPILLECFDRHGWFYGAFDETKLVGVVVVDSKRIGRRKDQLQLKFLHVSHSYRNQGLGRKLFELGRQAASERGATRLYISATPSENTVNFYLRLGCMVVAKPDPELFALEPEDIHLECVV